MHRIRHTNYAPFDPGVFPAVPHRRQRSPSHQHHVGGHRGVLGANLVRASLAAAQTEQERDNAEWNLCFQGTQEHDKHKELRISSVDQIERFPRDVLNDGTSCLVSF